MSPLSDRRLPRDDVRTWVSVDFQPPDRFGSCFDAAFEARTALRATGRRAYLFSVREPLDLTRPERFRPGGLDVVYPVAETCREYPGDPVGLRRLAAERGIAVIGSPWDVVRAASDKLRAREVMSEAGFDVPAGSAVEPGPDFDEQIATVLASIGVPAVVKPSTGRGGSLGVEYLPDERALRRHLRRLFARGPEAVLVEEFVRGIEVTAWVWERDNHDVVDLVEIEKEGPIFTRNSKTGYRREGLHLHEEYPTAQLHRPPRLPAAVLARVEETAIGVHRLFGARGYSRTDLIVRDDRPVVLEINTTPRLRAESSFGMSPERTGGFAALLATLVDDAVSSGPLPRADAPRSVASRPW